MTWIRKLIRRSYLRKVFAWFILFSLIYPPITPVAVPVFLVLTRVFQYVVCASPAIIGLIGLEHQSFPLEIPTRDNVGSIVFDHLQQSQKVAQASISTTARATATQAISRAWSVVINEAPAAISYSPSVGSTNGGFLEVAAKGGINITIPFKALSIGMNVITAAHTANQIVKYYQNSDALTKTDIDRINQEEKSHQYKLETNMEYAQQYIRHKLETISLISQVPGHYSDAKRFIACKELFYGYTNQLEGWDRIAATQALNALRKVNIDGNGIIKAKLTAEEQGDALYIYNTFQSQIDRRANYESYRKAVEQFKVTTNSEAPSINEYIFKWHKKGEKGAESWLTTLNGNMPFNQDRRELYVKHKKLFDAINGAFKEYYRKQRLAYTQDGFLKVAQNDLLYKGLSAQAKKELLADGKKLSQFNTILAARNEYKIAVEKILKLTKEQASSFVADTYQIIDLLMAETPSEQIIEYLVASCATDTKYNLFFDGNGILKFRAENQKNMIVGHPQFARYNQADHKKLLVSLNKLAFLHQTAENARFITQAYDFLNHASQASEAKIVEIYVKSFDEIYPLLADAKITQERLAIKFDVLKNEIDQVKSFVNTALQESTIITQNPKVVLAETTSVPLAPQASEQKVIPANTVLMPSTASTPQASKALAAETTTSALLQLPVPALNPNPYAHITFTPSINAMGMRLEDVLAILQQEYAYDQPEVPRSAQKSVTPSVDTVDTGNYAPLPPENGPEDKKDEEKNDNQENQNNLENQTKEQLLKSKRSHEKLLEEHEHKLTEYIKNPDEYDNLGKLKNASPELRKQIIEGRIQALNKQIMKHKRLLKETQIILEKKFGVKS